MVFIVLFGILSCERDITLVEPEEHVDQMIEQMHSLGVTSYTRYIEGNETVINIKAETPNESNFFQDYRIKLTNHEDNTWSVSTHNTQESNFVMEINLVSGDIKLIHNSKEEELSEENSLIATFLLLNFIEQTNAVLPRMDKTLYLSKVRDIKKYGKTPGSGTEDCKRTSAALSVTRGDAAASASSSSPGDSCVRSGEPGCVCATGIWGGDIACACIQVWNCSDPVTCLNVN